jgi:hypothetical protein
LAEQRAGLRLEPSPEVQLKPGDVNILKSPTGTLGPTGSLGSPGQNRGPAQMPPVAEQATEDDYTSRLLKAKKKVRDDLDQDKK